jgi:hypothetical protein
LLSYQLHNSNLLFSGVCAYFSTYLLLQGSQGSIREQIYIPCFLVLHVINSWNSGSFESFEDLHKAKRWTYLQSGLVCLATTSMPFQGKCSLSFCLSDLISIILVVSFVEEIKGISCHACHWRTPSWSKQLTGSRVVCAITRLVKSQVSFFNLTLDFSRVSNKPHFIFSIRQWRVLHIVP